MNTYEMDTNRIKKLTSNVLSDDIREKILVYAKDFKTSWVNLAQHLFAVYNDKLYHAWGYEKFEHYIQREVGLSKPLGIKLVKTYYFLEQDEPTYLNSSFKETRDTNKIPDLDAINVLRLAKSKKELLKEDYQNLKNAIFEKGKDVSTVRKELTAMMKERKPVDPEKEREERSLSSLRKVIHSLQTFKKDMLALKSVPDELVSMAEELAEQLEKELP